MLRVFTDYSDAALAFDDFAAEDVLSERDLQNYLSIYQDLKDDILDGKRLFEDITYMDSCGREFYALPDGSYFLIENEETKLFGEAYRIADGAVRQVCWMEEKY